MSLGLLKRNWDMLLLSLWVTQKRKEKMKIKANKYLANLFNCSSLNLKLCSMSLLNSTGNVEVRNVKPLII